MPKKSVVAPSKVLTPRQISRRQKERQRQRITVLVGLAIIVLIVGVMGYGFSTSRIAPRWQPAVRVDDTTYNLKYFANYVRLAVGNRPSKDAQIVQSLAPSIVSEIQDNEIVKRGAAKLGITVNDDDINQVIRDGLVSPDEKDKVDEAEIGRRFRRLVANLKLSEDFYRQIAANTALRKKIQEKLEGQMPTQAEQVKLSAILLDTDVEAQEVSGKLRSGGDFVALAKEFSKDDATKDTGGDMGWAPQSLYPELDQVAFSLAPGTTSEPIATSKGYYIVKVTEKEASRALDEDTVRSMKSRVFSDWLEKARQDNVLENFVLNKETGRVDPKKMDWILLQLK